MRFLISVTLVGVMAICWRAVAGLWTSPQEHFNIARAALDQGDVETVRRELAALEGKPAFAPHRRFLIGSLMLREGRFDDALLEYEYSIPYPDLQVDSLIRSGQAYYQTGRAGNAQQLWNRVLELQPDNVDVHRWLGVLYYDVGAMDVALLHLKKVSELAPSDPRPDRLMGLINRDYERPDEAVKHYRESLSRDPNQADRPQILLELARSQIKLFEHAAALETLNDCPESAEREVLRAECHLSLGNKELARTTLMNALAADPDDKEALLLRGRMELEDGQIEQAIASLYRATELFPKDYVVRFKIVQALRRAGKKEEADAQEKIANELQVVWRRFSDLHMTALKEPRNAAARQELGMLALQLDRPDLAKNWFQATLAIEPDNQTVHAEMEKLLQLNGSAPGETHAVGEQTRSSGNK